MSTYGIEENIDWDALVASAEPVIELPPHCYKLNIEVDKNKLFPDFITLIERLGYSYDDFINLQKEYGTTVRKLTEPTAEEPIAWDMNFNHLPHLKGNDRWGKHRGTFEMIFNENINPAEYSVLLKELEDLHLGHVIRNVFSFHKKTFGRDFRGRSNIIWIAANKGYNFHFDDDRTPIRYHIPLVTNNKATWIFRDNSDSNKFYTMHMPYGTVWQFFPTSIDHTVRNMGPTDRAHLIITEVNV